MYVERKLNSTVASGAQTAAETTDGTKRYGLIKILGNWTLGVTNPWAILAPRLFCRQDIAVKATNWAVVPIKAAAEETAEEVTEETEETESAEPETVEEIEEFEETIEEPEEEPEPEPSEPIELAMPVYTAEELLQKAHAAGDDPKVIEDPATGITILDYSDIL